MRTLIAAVIILGGCATGLKMQVLGDFDSTEKTMAVDRGGNALLGAIKLRLKSAGWKLTFEEKGKPEEASAVEAKPRYKLFVNSIAGGSDSFRFDLSIADNKTGQEILMMSGKGGDAEIADRLLVAIKRASY